MIIKDRIINALIRKTGEKVLIKANDIINKKEPSLKERIKNKLLKDKKNN